MARGMKRKLDPVARQDLPVGRRLDRDVAQALAKYGRRVAMADVNLRAKTRVIGMRMGDDGARDGSPGIDMKIARGAIEPAVGGSDEIQGCAFCEGWTAQYGVGEGEVELARRGRLSRRGAARRSGRNQGGSRRRPATTRAALSHKKRGSGIDRRRPRGPRRPRPSGRPGRSSWPRAPRRRAETD